MIDGIFEGVIKGVLIGAAIGLILAGLLKAIAKSKTIERGAEEYDRTLEGYIENQILSSTVGKYGRVYANEKSLDFFIGAEFLKPTRFSVPYEKVHKYEFCDEFAFDKDNPPKLEDIPNHFIVEFEANDGNIVRLGFDCTNFKKETLASLYPNNIFDLVNARIEIAKNTSTSTDSPSKN